MKLYKFIYRLITVLLTLPLGYMFVVNSLSANLLSVLILFLILVVIWSGCVLANKGYLIHSWLCAFVICLSFFYRLWERLVSIQTIGDIEGKGGDGSPMAFIVGMFFENVILVCYLVPVIYGVLLWRKSIASVA